MNISDVKVGDRCWVAIRRDPDRNGTNATILRVGAESVSMKTDGDVQISGFPGVDTFWCKPIAPPKPKRKVQKDGYGNLFYDGARTFCTGRVYDDKKTATMNLSDGCKIAYITWEEEE
jgi:hypothetical protein